eukprot:scaffold4663_cov109-Cylindrotheca_fusiformis.AAC.1
MTRLSSSSSNSNEDASFVTCLPVVMASGLQNNNKEEKNSNDEVHEDVQQEEEKKVSEGSDGPYTAPSLFLAPRTILQGSTTEQTAANKRPSGSSSVDMSIYTSNNNTANNNNNNSSSLSVASPGADPSQVQQDDDDDAHTALSSIEVLHKSSGDGDQKNEVAIEVTEGADDDVENHHSSNNSNEGKDPSMPTREIQRQHSHAARQETPTTRNVKYMVPINSSSPHATTTTTALPNLVMVDRSSRSTPPRAAPPAHPFRPTPPRPAAATSSGAVSIGTSTVSSLYTSGVGHDASTLTKDTFLPVTTTTTTTNAADITNPPTTTTNTTPTTNTVDDIVLAVGGVDPEAPLQEATPHYDEYASYYNPENTEMASSDGAGSVGGSTVTSLTKDTGILRTEQQAAANPQDLPYTNGLMDQSIMNTTTESTSYITPPRGDRKYRSKPLTPSTAASVDEEYGYVQNDGRHSKYHRDGGDGGEDLTGCSKFLHQATRDPTVQCLISLACIFAVILFFLVAVIIVLTTEDIGINLG